MKFVFESWDLIQVSTDNVVIFLYFYVDQALIYTVNIIQEDTKALKNLFIKK